MLSYLRSAPAKEKAPDRPKTTKAILTPPSKPPAAAPLTAEQEKAIAELEEYTATLLLPESDPYHVWEKRFLADVGTHHRYMRAAKWKLDDAKKRIKGTLEWRREYKPDLITLEEVKDAATAGKLLVNGFDKEQRPILYMRPGRGPPPDHQANVRYLIFLLERAIDLMPNGQEKLCIIVDFTDQSKQPMQPMSVSMYVLNVLQNHYVERMGRGLVLNMPWIVNGFFKAIRPFLDPVTKDKIRFSPSLIELINPEQLETDYEGGEHAFELDIDIYLRDIKEACCLADDGTREYEGAPWVPPSGRGIAHAKAARAEAKGDNGSVETVAAALEKTVVTEADAAEPAPAVTA